MARLTIADLIDGQVFTILRELKDEWLPLQEIIEETLIFEESENLILVGENSIRMRFTKQYVDVVRRAFKSAEWFLAQPSKRKSAEGISLLIGVWPRNHYLVLTPKKRKQPNKKEEY